MPLSAVIFDFDGVVIDSHEAHERSWFMLAEELGQTLTRETFVSTFGQRNESILPFLGWAEEGDRERIQQLGDRKESLYREILRADGIEPLPGVVTCGLFSLAGADVALLATQSGIRRLDRKA